MSTTLQHTDSGATGTTRLSVALIGPNDTSRKIMAKALSAGGTRTVKEFSDYPSNLGDVAHFADEFDFVIIDFDSDESYAIKIVEEIAASGSTTVMVYSVRNDPNLVITAMRAGARDFLPLPEEAQVESAPPAAAPTPVEPQVEQKPAPVRKETAPIRQAALRPIEPQVAPEKRLSAVVSDTATENVRRPLPPRESILSDAIAPDFNDQNSAQLHALKASVLRDSEVSSRFSSATELPIAIETKVLPSPDPVPLFRASGAIETDADVLALFRSAQIAENEQPKSDWKKWVYIAAGPVVLVIVLLIVFLHPFRTSSSDVPAHATAPQPEAPVTAPPDVRAATVPDSAPKSWQPITSAAAAETTKPSPATPASENKVPVSSAMMDAQLNAPAKISSDVKKPNTQEEAPGALAMNSIDNSGGLPGTVLNGGSKVSVVPVVSKISAGVAEGMLIHKTEPVYPRFAKDNHIGGTVVLKASITKTGGLAGLRVVSGPKILATAAMDAAKNWRYRPYMLDNQPVEVETTISVVFSLGK